MKYNVRQCPLKFDLEFGGCDGCQTWASLEKATGEEGADGKDGKDGDSFFKSITTSNEIFL